MGEINPSTRQEIFLKGVADAMSGETASTITPSSREEMFLQNIIDAASGDEASYDLAPATREEYFLDKIADAASGGGGGGDVTVEALSVTSNNTYTAPSGKAYSPITVNVPNSYAAGDEGKVVSSGALVSQSSATYTTNNTYDTTLINSVTVNVSGGGGSSWELVGSSEFAVSTESTSETTVGDVALSVDSFDKNDIFYVHIRDKAGARNNYFYGNNGFYFCMGAANGSSSYNLQGMAQSWRVKSDGKYDYLSGQYGVYATQIQASNKLAKIASRYVSGIIIDGTYKVEVYKLTRPTGVVIFE